MQPAIEALTAEKYFNPSVQAAGKKIIMESVADVINEIKVRKEIDNDEVKKSLIEKLETIKIIAMFPDEVLNATKIQEIYEELTIDGSESFVYLYQAVEKHYKKIKSENSTSWMKILKITMSTDGFAHYDEIKNEFCKMFCQVKFSS